MKNTRQIESVIAVLLARVALPTAGFSQTDPVDEQSGVGEIVVTARKSKETLTDVPVAITALTGDALNKRGITDVQDLAAFTPGGHAVN